MSFFGEETSILRSNLVQHAWRNGGVEREDDAAVSYALKLLQRLENILHEESRRAAPHSCLRYVTSSQSYIIITKLSVSSRNVEIIRTSAQLFHILINGEAEALLDSKLFTRSLLDLVCYATIGGKIIVEERLETDLVELLFDIATKIRLDPDILPAWFYPDRESVRGRNAIDDTRKSQFPLFHVLVQYVHHDGSVGDFARTALLYLTETASKFKPLETWMIESDLAPQMASGLGALYSRLSRESTSLSGQVSAPPIITLSDHTETLVSLSESPHEVQQDVKAFFSYLAFWQDTLNHCRSAEVSDTLLDHFQVLFVQQLLYPSLLESSDVEGGSTAAVVAHLSRILLALDHWQLVDRILRYLLASPNMPQEPKEKTHRRQRMSVSRRKSIDHLKALAEVADSPSPNLFNLLDLMVMSLKSRHPETVNACLKLLSVIVERHHPHVLTSLFRLEPALLAQSEHGVKQLNGCLMKLFDYSAAIAKNIDRDSSYQAALLDGQIVIERHSCLTTAQDEPQLESRYMSIARECKLFEAVATLLRSFFANDTVTNLYLTEAFMTLAACEHMDLHGWLLQSSKQSHTEDNSALNITFIIGELVEQVRQWRSQFSEWDELIVERRMELSEDEPYNRPFNARTSSQIKEIDTRLMSDSPSGTQLPPHSRPSTPKGRKIPTTEFGSIDSAISKPGGHRTSLVERSLGHSLLRQSLEPDENEEPVALNETPVQPTSAALLKTQIALYHLKTPEEASESLPVHAGRKQTPSTSPDPGDRRLALGMTGESGTATPSGRDDLTPRSQASLSHVLTNAIILQEFILEIAAVVQLRATFFGEVEYGANAQQ